MKREADCNSTTEAMAADYLLEQYGRRQIEYMAM